VFTGDPISRTGGPAQVCSAMGTQIEIGYGEEKNIFTDQSAPEALQDKNLLYDTTSPTNQRRKDPLYLYSVTVSPRLPQLQQTAGRPPFSGLSSVPESNKWEIYDFFSFSD
jgi:hypothetical protein